MIGWPLFRQVLIENVMILMVLLSMYFIYVTENARFGHCICDPKLVAKKGQEMYYSGPGSAKLMAHQEYGCICSARDNRIYLSSLLWICISCAISGIALIIYCSKNGELTAKFTKVMMQLLIGFQSFGRKCCETKEEKKRREEKAEREAEKKKEKNKNSEFTKFIDKHPMTFYIVMSGFIIYVIGDNLMKSEKPIMELIQDNKFIEPALGIGFALAIVTVCTLFYAKEETEEDKERKKNETEDQKWSKKVSNIWLKLTGVLGAIYMVLALVGHSIKNNLKFSDLLSFKQWEIPIYMTLIFACVFLCVQFIIDGEKYLLKKINPAVYDDDYEEIKL